MTDEIACGFGIILWFVVMSFWSFKKLNNDDTIKISLFVTGFVATYPLILRLTHQPYTGHARMTDAMFSPFIYVVSYGLLRFLYKKIYNREPIYNRMSWYDLDSRRKQNLLDVIVAVVPIFFSALFFFLIN